MANSIVYPRKLAVRVLTRVLSDHEPLDEVLKELAVDLPSDSAAWLQEICSGTLRWKGRLDLILDSTALKKKPSGWLRKMLLLASYQLVVQDRAPAPLVVSETVSEIKAKEGNAPAQFANACLRKIADHALQWRELALPEKSSDFEAAQWASLPEWFWKKILKQKGFGWSMRFAQASLDRPVLWLRARDSEGSSSLTADWAERGPIPGALRERLDGQVRSRGLVTEKSGFQEGEWIVQDISSQLLIAEVMAEIRPVFNHAPLQALDLCAAPGGKSVGLAWSGARVTATDFVEKRVPLLRQTVNRVDPTGSLIRVIPWSELHLHWNQDLIWVDAPCTGTGILRRHPDVRWLRREEELEGLVQTQRELLRKAWANARSGSFVVYSVCSVLKEEGPDAIHAAELSSFQVKAWSLEPHSAPHGDGFWAALLRKP